MLGASSAMLHLGLHTKGERTRAKTITVAEQNYASGSPSTLTLTETGGTWSVGAPPGWTTKGWIRIPGYDDGAQTCSR